ncbi:hypothetical protein [Streptomyces sp. NBC_00306]|uniref:hypothetical protein n=1 Tax=Streptomyces sp. NBC_00306 TaxID=2975708 RepID=UPI002E290913|nr:hypothetical protein [Streptomyces sp. NBC_00306]
MADQQQEVGGRAQFLLADRPALVAGAQEGAEQVHGAGPFAGPLLGDQRVQEPVQFPFGACRIGGYLGGDGGHEGVSGFRRVQVFGNAEDGADHPERQRCREVRDQIDVCVVLDPIQQPVRDLADERFQDGGAAGHERGVDQGPQPGVVRRVGVDQVPVEAGRARYVSRNPVRVLAQTGIGEQSAYVLVAGDLPHHGPSRPPLDVRGRMAAQPRKVRVGIPYPRGHKVGRRVGGVSRHGFSSTVLINRRPTNEASHQEIRQHMTLLAHPIPPGGTRVSPAHSITRPPRGRATLPALPP